MADTDEDDGYSDDDLDALDHDALLQLEERALQSTQFPPHEEQIIQPTVINVEEGLGLSNYLHNDSHSVAADQPSSDYGDLDEVLDEGAVEEESSLPAQPSRRQLPHAAPPAKIDEATRREQWRQARYGAPQLRFGSNSPPSTRNSAVNLPHRGPSVSSPGLNSRGDDDDSEFRRLFAPLDDNFNPLVEPEDETNARETLAKLLAEKRQWESERAALQRNVKAAQDQVVGKAGEIAIIRSNYAKQDRNYERLLNDLKRQQWEKDEVHKDELENARKEREKLTTYNRFLDHEISDTTWQPKQNKKGAKGKGTDAASPQSKRQRNDPFGDGFDSPLVITTSPVKPTGRAKAQESKNAAKRKREVSHENTATHLQSSLDDGIHIFKSSAPIITESALRRERDAARKGDARFEFLGKILNHRMRRGEKRTFEALAVHHLPSKPDTALSTLFVDKIAPANIKQGSDDFPAVVGINVLALWSECLTEQYYNPLKLLIDLVNFILLNGSSDTPARLMDDIVSLAQATADINIIPRFQLLNKKARLTGGPAGDLPAEPSTEIDSQDCLQLLLLTASLCASTPHLMARFWHRMRLDFISVVLRISQTIEDIIAMTQLLETCARDDNFAEIASQSPDEQTAGEHIVDRISSMLIEIPRPLDGSPDYDPAEIWQMRLHLLRVIQQICDQRDCGRTFAMHSHAIGRLVRLMNDELTAIYSHQYYGHDKRVEIVTRATRILYRIHVTYGSGGGASGGPGGVGDSVGATNTDGGGRVVAGTATKAGTNTNTGAGATDEISLQAKLRTQPGGVNKFLITLARLAFSDAPPVLYERGFGEDVFDCAHQMLEDFVTPEEADSLRRAFIREE